MPPEPCEDFLAHNTHIVENDGSIPSLSVLCFALELGMPPIYFVKAVISV